MRIRFTVDGGIAHFPGLARTVWIDTEELPQEEATDLARKLERARPFGSGDGDAKGTPDTGRYTVAVADAGREETLVFREPPANPAVSELLEDLRRYRVRDARRGEKVKIARDVYVVKGAAPEAGTRLTLEKIKDGFRWLNQSERRGGEPMEHEGVVSRDPEVMNGALVFAGTRVPVEVLAEYLAAGDPLDAFLEAIPTVSREQAVAYLRFSIAAVDARRHR